MRRHRAEDTVTTPTNAPPATAGGAFSTLHHRQRQRRHRLHPQRRPTDKLDLCRQRVQQQTCGHRGRAGDPLYRVRRTLRTRYPLLRSRQKARLQAVFADENHLAAEIFWGFYPRLIAPYAHPDRRRGKTMMATIINSLRGGLPAGLEELA